MMVRAALARTGNGNLHICWADDILYDLWEDDEDLLGLDHVDRNTRNGWGRGGGPEIRIR